jgi:hypothetical protein
MGHAIESTSKSPRDCTDETIEGGFEFVLLRQLISYELVGTYQDGLEALNDFLEILFLLFDHLDQFGVLPISPDPQVN